jgi:hypothetical protein
VAASPIHEVPVVLEADLRGYPVVQGHTVPPSAAHGGQYPGQLRVDGGSGAAAPTACLPGVWADPGALGVAGALRSGDQSVGRSGSPVVPGVADQTGSLLAG